MDWLIILASGVATGTVLLYATVGEIYAERSGVLNLGVEGMMLVGAMTAYKVSAATGSPWLGLLVGMIAAGVISQVHAFIAITLQADQVVSGLALAIFGTGLSAFLGFPYVNVPAPKFTPLAVPLLERIPFFGPALFDHDVTVYAAYALVPLAWFWNLPLRAHRKSPCSDRPKPRLR